MRRRPSKLVEQKDAEARAHQCRGLGCVKLTHNLGGLCNKCLKLAEAWFQERARRLGSAGVPS